MGSSSSIIVTKSVEISFVDKITGTLLPEDKIIEISKQVCKDFDYNPSFYSAYKIDKNGNNPYEQYKANLYNKTIK